MSVFRYYIPGKSREDITVELMESLGLAERLWDCLTGDMHARLGMGNVEAKGPDGSSGVLLTPMPRSGEMIPRQGWSADQNAVEHDGYWIVTDPDAPPTPTGMERCQQVDGYVRELGDGSHWLCPVVRSELDKSDLPRAYLQRDGEIFGMIEPRYRDIWMRSVKWCIRFLDQARDIPATKFLGVHEAFEGAVECLALNYRVSAEELALLPGLLTDESITSVLDAAIDWDFYADVDTDPQKKRSLRGVQDAFQSLLLGSGESIPDTDQPAPTLNSSDAATLPTTETASPSSLQGA